MKDMDVYYEHGISVSGTYQDDIIGSGERERENKTLGLVSLQ